MGRTALIAPVRLPVQLARRRRDEVEVARRGVPPHVTILSPFLDSSAVDQSVHERLVGIAATVVAFEVEFRAVRRWPASTVGPGLVWLAPQPSEPFVRLTRAVWAAWPDRPPYGRADDPLEAHLTVAIDALARFDRAELEARAALPFRRRVDAITLVVEGRAGRWRRVRSYPLA